MWQEADQGSADRQLISVTSTVRAASSGDEQIKPGWLEQYSIVHSTVQYTFLSKFVIIFHTYSYVHQCMYSGQTCSWSPWLIISSSLA